MINLKFSMLIHIMFFMRNAYVFIYRMFVPIMIGGLLTYFNPEESKQTDVVHAYIYASGLTISMLGSLFIYHFVTIEMTHSGMKFRIACCVTIYRKVFNKTS